jgi:hypothetical protein
LKQNQAQAYTQTKVPALSGQSEWKPTLGGLDVFDEGESPCDGYLFHMRIKRPICGGGVSWMFQYVTTGLR